MWKPLLIQRMAREEMKVSEGLNSVETNTVRSHAKREHGFQKDLIVWKQNRAINNWFLCCGFQKDLVVWKPHITITHSFHSPHVSEGLSSVETLNLKYRMVRGHLRFRRT